MDLVWYIIFSYLFVLSELKPVEEIVPLKLPITIESGMNIILVGMLNNEHDQLSLTFSGDKMNEQDEWHVTYIPQKRKVCLIHNGEETVLFTPKFSPDRFLLQFQARTVSDVDRDQHVMELYYEENLNETQSSEGFIELPSFQIVDYINVKGFSNLHNVTFSFNR